jgi:transcriptional repressor NrdR
VHCPFCSGDSAVSDSRATGDGQIRRRRICNQCKRRFTTYERVGAPGLKVVKRSGKTEDFSPEKLRICLERVCRHRTVLDQVTVLARAIEADLLDSGAKKIPSSRIADLVLARLRDADRVSWNRMAANYVAEDGQLRTATPAEDERDSEQLGLFESGSDDG